MDHRLGPHPRDVHRRRGAREVWGVYLGEALLAFGLPFPATCDRRHRDQLAAFLIVAVVTRCSSPARSSPRASARLHDHQGRDRAVRDRRRASSSTRRTSRRSSPSSATEGGRRMPVAVAARGRRVPPRTVRRLRHALGRAARVLRIHRLRRRRDERRGGARPQKRLPRGIFIGLAIVTVLYVLVSIVMTGMVSYRSSPEEIRRSRPRSALVGRTGLGVIAVGALAGLTTVIMVLLLGLSRIDFALSRDGLLPRWLSKTTEHTKTPARIQIIGGATVAFVAAIHRCRPPRGDDQDRTLSAIVREPRHRRAAATRRDLPRGFRVAVVARACRSSRRCCASGSR